MVYEVNALRISMALDIRISSDMILTHVFFLFSGEWLRIPACQEEREFTSILLTYQQTILSQNPQTK